MNIKINRTVAQLLWFFIFAIVCFALMYLTQKLTSNTTIQLFVGCGVTVFYYAGKDYINSLFDKDS